MAAEKKWNLQSFAINPKLFGQSQTYVITCAGQNTFINLNDTSIILTLNVSGLPEMATYSVLRPSTTWVTQIQTEIKFQTDRGQEIKNYAGYVNRGLAANMLEIFEYSQPKFNMLTPVEFLTPTTGLTSTTFNALIPLKFLCDPAYDAALLNLDSIAFTIAWEQQANIFSFSSGTPIVTVDKVDFKFATTTVTSKDVIPKHIREIPNRQVYIQTDFVAAGSNSVSSYVTVAFPCSELFYFFVGQGSNYTLNPNPSAIVTTHQLASMGSVYPLVSNYQASYNPGVIETGGVLRHWDELISIVGKDTPEFSNTLSYTNWRDNLRIYGIEIGTEQRTGQAFNFQSSFDKVTTVPCTCIMVFVGRGHI
jgi:hypothetical protein